MRTTYANAYSKNCVNSPRDDRRIFLTFFKRAYLHNVSASGEKEDVSGSRSRWPLINYLFGNLA